MDAGNSKEKVIYIGLPRHVVAICAKSKSP